MAEGNDEWDKICTSVQSLACENNKFIYSNKTPTRKPADETRKNRNEYELIDGSYLTTSESKIRKKSKKSKGGKNCKITDFPITVVETKSPGSSKNVHLEDLIIGKKKKKNTSKKAVTRRSAAAKINNNHQSYDFGYSELEAILRAVDSIINDPDKGILEWADSIFNPDEIYNFAETLSSDSEDDDEDVIEISDDEDEDDEIQYIPKKAQQHRVGVCPKCSATRKLVNFVWECECASKWDISDNFYGIVNGFDQPYPHKEVAGYSQSSRKNAIGRKSYASAARGKIYEKKPLRGKEVSLLAHRLKGVSLNPSAAAATPSSSKVSKKPILRSLLQDDPTWALQSPINFTPQKTTFYDLIHEPESIFGSSYSNPFGGSKSRDRPTPADYSCLRDLLGETSPKAASIIRKQTSRFTQTATEIPSSSKSPAAKYSTLKDDLEQEKLHRKAVEAKVAALEMKFSQCLSMIEESLPSLTTKLNNLSLTCSHINKICETTKAEKQSAMDELKAAKDRISMLEKEQEKFQQQSNKIPATVSSSKNDIVVIDDIDVNDSNDGDEDDKDSEYSFVY